MKTSYIYNKVKTIKGVMLLSLGSFMLSGCGDFLDILPMDQVVLENYWKEKKDVTSAMNSCYEALADQDVVTRMGVWGELRSENILAGSNSGVDLNELLKENLLPVNSMCNWAGFYNVINRCNVVINYAPEVEVADANYTRAELNATIAEATTLRALAYFYLIRTFRDVPYTTQPSIDDNQNYVLPATPFEDVLDSLINDLERVKNMALTRYSQEKVSNNQVIVPNDNNSRITRCAVYALLADLYLWKGDWDRVIENCDYVINYKKALYDELVQTDQLNSIGLYSIKDYKVPMILESKPGAAKEVGVAYTDIFGRKNSFESLFEIYYNGASRQENNWVANYYGSSSNALGRLRASDFLGDGFDTDKNQVFLSQRDCRYYESLQARDNTYVITKYVWENTDFSLQTPSNVSMAKCNRRSNKSANWIIYRLSDVLLMKAEALIQRGEADYEEAYQLINTVFKRANAIAPDGSGTSLTFEDYSGSKTQMEDLLLEERHREFLFEGKRWYDLVRASRRDGDTKRLSSCVIRKFTQDTNLIKIKLADPNYVYFPYLKSELKANPLLKQNPAFNKGEDSELK